MPLDPYYLIFGSSDIRIGYHQNTVYSNFGVEASYFKSSYNLTVDDLLNCGDKR